MVTYKIQVYQLIKRNIYLVLLLIIGLFFLFPLFHPGFYLSHDGFAHVARFAAYFNSYMDGQFPARWAGDLNRGYGTPLFIFFYPLPGFIASTLHSLGLSFETAFKIIIGTSFIFAPIFLFSWLKKQAKEEVAFSVAIIYMLLPYRFLDTYVRGDVAEMLSFVFIPLIFIFIDKVLQKKQITDVLIGSIFYALFIMAHNGMALIFSPVFLVYILIFIKKRKDFIYSLGIFAFGICLSSFFWLPSIFESKYVVAGTSLANLYKDNFVPLLNLFYSNWGFGPDVNSKGGLSPQIGVLHTIIPFIFLIFINEIKEKKRAFFWFIIFIAAIFMTTSYSSLLWDKLPFLKLLGFPWRLTSLSGFAACMLIFYGLKHFNRGIFLAILVGLFLFSSLPFVRVDKYIPSRSDDFYFSYKGTTDYNLRTSTVWIGQDFDFPAKHNVEIIGGQGTIKSLSRTSNFHEYLVEAKTNLSILDNTEYFPGWRAEVDGVKTPIQFQDMNHRGLITFNVPSGEHSVKVKFKETPIRLLSDIVSVVSLALIVGVLLLGNRLKKYTRK
jgi:uncharacterized membrane protein